MSAPQTPPKGRDLAVLSLAALGVVYGDIGTSPIYAIRESFHAGHGIPATNANTYGILSLIFWALILVISVKYLVLVLKADNKGEGGIIALTALVMPRGRAAPKGASHVLVLLGLFGAALLYGDSMITPAISVLSAVEGLQIAVPALDPYVIPITVAILVSLFLVQSRGTERIGIVFGPIMMIWFATLGLLGIYHVFNHPRVLSSVNPIHAVRFFQENELRGFLVLGSIFLVVTGGEALYADMGHFGKKPIRLTWWGFVLPALVMNYFGQGALILDDPATAEAPFFSMVPAWASLPLVILTTAATVIASQAVISGAFSLTRQAVQLGYLPRLIVRHTSDKHIGQIYLPAVNWALMVACIGLVIGFKTSSTLAGAYGVAVTTDMVFTTLLFAVVATTRFRWPLAIVIAMTASLLLVDVSFWSSALPKIPAGGWFPLAVALTVFTFMTTWKRGRAILIERFENQSMGLEGFIESIKGHPPQRVPGTAIFMTTRPDAVPRVLLHNLKHNRVLHERVIVLSILSEDVPTVEDEDRFEVSDLGLGFHRVIAHFGFAEGPDVPTIMRKVEIPGYKYNEMDNSFFLGEVAVSISRKPAMARWRCALFTRMQRNALRAPLYFNIPPNRVVGLGAQVEI